MDTFSKEILPLELKQKKPTVIWLERWIDGFDLVDIWAIWESEIIFDNFIVGLLKIGNTSETEIVACVDKAIFKSFSKIANRLR